MKNWIFLNILCLGLFVIIGYYHAEWQHHITVLLDCYLLAIYGYALYKYLIQKNQL